LARLTADRLLGAEGTHSAPRGDSPTVGHDRGLADGDGVHSVVRVVARNGPRRFLPGGVARAGRLGCDPVRSGRALETEKNPGVDLPAPALLGLGAGRRLARGGRLVSQISDGNHLRWGR